MNTNTIHNRTSTVVRDILSKDAWQMLQQDKAAALVDVRTDWEWQNVGTPDLSVIHKQPLFLQWRTAPGMRPNPDFIAQLQQAVPDSNTPLLFLCKAGGRSLEAAHAAAQAGYHSCINVADGFEGTPAAFDPTGTLTGWQATALPWRLGA